MKPIVGIDRDGTLILNTGDFPGSAWPDEKVEFMPKVIEGMCLLKEGGCLVVMITNQSGPARGKVKVEHIGPFNSHINSILQDSSAGFDGIYFCAHAPESYAAENQLKGNYIDREFICACPDWKPGIGLLEKASQELCASPLQQNVVYMIGDRVTDVETGLNAGGKGIFVKTDFEGDNHLRSALQLQERNPHRVYIADDFLAAARFVIRDFQSRQC